MAIKNHRKVFISDLHTVRDIAKKAGIDVTGLRIRRDHPRDQYCEVYQHGRKIWAGFAQTQGMAKSYALTELMYPEVRQGRERTVNGMTFSEAVDIRINDAIERGLEKERLRMENTRVEQA